MIAITEAGDAMELSSIKQMGRRRKGHCMQHSHEAFL
jgi:hypothetical protein